MVPNLGIFLFLWNFVFRQIRGCWFQIWQYFIKIFFLNIFLNFGFFYLNIKTISSKLFSYFLRLLLVFSKVFLFNDGEITEGEKKSSWEDESRRGLHCFKKHAIFLLYKNMEDTIQIQIQDKKSNPRTMNILTCKESEFSISILSRAPLEKI